MDFQDPEQLLGRRVRAWEDFDPEIVHSEIKEYLIQNPPFSDYASALLNELRSLPPDRSLRQFLHDTAASIPEELTIGDTIQKTVFGFTDPFIDQLAQHLLTRLITGQVEEVPQDWIGVVRENKLFGIQTVFAMAGPLTDMTDLVKQFRDQFSKTFGKKKNRLTDAKVEGAQYLRLSLEGYKARDLVDVYISLHPDEYDRIKDPKKKKAYKERIYERLKKQMQRVQEYINEHGDSF